MIIQGCQEVCPYAQHAQLQGILRRGTAAGLGQLDAAAPAGRSHRGRAPATAAATPSAAPVPVICHCYTHEALRTAILPASLLVGPRLMGGAAKSHLGFCFSGQRPVVIKALGH